MNNKNLRLLRNKHNITQKQVAKVLNITVSAYSRKEKGTRQFTIDEACKIANIFNKTIEEVFVYNTLRNCLLSWTKGIRSGFYDRKRVK